MTRFTRFLAVLMSVLMLAVPTIALGETHVFCNVSDPVLTASGMTIDLTGLGMDFTAEQAEDLLHMLAVIGASGEKVLTAHAGFGASGIFAYAEGMSSAFVVTAETIKAYGDQIAQSSGFGSLEELMGMANVDPSTLFSEEAMGKFMTTVQGIASQVITGEPAEDTFTTLAGDEAAAIRYDFTLTGEQIAAVVEATAELLDSSETFNKALATQGMEASIKDMLKLDPTDVPTVSGSVFVATESQDAHAEGAITVDESSAPFVVDFTANEEGLLVTGTLNEPDEGDEQVAFQISATPSTTVPGEMTVLAEFGLYDTEDGEVDTVAYLTISAFAEPAADDAVTRIFHCAAGDDDNAVSVNTTFCNDPNNLLLSLSLSASSDGGDETMLAVSYSGVQIDQSLAGLFSASVVSGGETVLSLQANVAFGLNEGDSIAFDFSSVPNIDVTNMNEENAESVMTELQTVAQTALSKLMSIPGVSALLSAAQG